MFFVRESCIKVVAVILLVNACSTYAEPPISSSYLPPNQNDKSNPFSSSNNFDSNSQPIEASVSITTGDPISPFFSFGSGGNGPAPSNGYGPPNDNFSSNKVSTSGGISDINPFSQPPKRGQQSTGGNKGYFYQQPSPTFNEPGNGFGGGPTAPSQTGYPSGTVNPTGSSPISSSYFSTSPDALSASVSPTYGTPQNSFGAKENFATGPGSPNSKFGPSSNNALSTSYGPSPTNGSNYNGPSTLYETSGNTQASSPNFFNRQEQPNLSTNYGSPGAFDLSPTNYPSGNNFDLTSNSLDIGNTSPSGGRNPVSSYEPSSSGNRRPTEGTSQALLGSPSLIGIYGNPPSRGSTAGAFGSPSPSYGPPTNSYSIANIPQPFGQASTGANQNPSRPFDFTEAEFQNPPNQRQPSPTSSYGAPSPTASGAGYSSIRPFSSTAIQGEQNQVRPSASYGPPDSAEPQRGQNQGRPSSSYGAPSLGASNQARPSAAYSPSALAEPQRVQNQERPYSSYSAPSQVSQNQARPSSSYGPPASAEPQRLQNQERPSSSYGAPPQILSGTGYDQGTQNQERPSTLYGAPSQNSLKTGYSQGTQNQARPSSTYGAPPQNSLETDFSQNAQNQASPSSTYGAPSSNAGIEYNQGAQNQGRPSSSYGPPSQNVQGSGFGQNSQNRGRPSSLNPSNSYPNSAPSSLYSPPSNFNTPSSNSFQKDRSSQYQLPSNVFEPPLKLESKRPQSSYGPPSPTSTFSSSGGAFPTSYELSSPSNSRAPSGTFSIQSSISPSYSDSTSNSFSSPESTGYPAALTGSGFAPNVSPTYEAPLSNTVEYKKDKNPKEPSLTYGSPGQNLEGPSFGQGSSYATPSSIGQLSNSKGSSLSSPYGAPSDQGTRQPNFSNSFVSPSPSNRPNDVNGIPSNSYGLPAQSTNDFSSGDNSLSFSPSFGPTNSGFSDTQPEQNIFNSNVGSSYLPPSYSEGTGIPSTPFEGSIIPSTSYTLPGDQPNSSKRGPSNTFKNANRNVGSDLITGASTSPFRPFNDDSPGYAASSAPSRANYEKSHELSNNELSSTGSDSSEPAKYEFNYNVKDAGTEFNHQESRNGSTTSGSYGVVLPDGRKQVVDYEANQEGFHPKIRYEENLSNSVQQNQGTRGQTNQGFDSTQSQTNGYNYSPANQPSGSPFPQPGSNYNQDLQPPYLGNSDYNQGSTGTQESYPSNPASTPQSGYPDSVANFNTYKNQATSPSADREPFTYQENQSSQSASNSQGYNYSPSGDSNNNQGYSSGPNKPEGKQIPFFT